MRSDIEIAQSTTLLPIDRVARKLGLGEEDLERNGQYMAKLRLPREKRKQRGKLILVTAINPTQAGEGKTTTSIGLADAMNRLGAKTVLAMREPSLGPVFGLKGGATGGGEHRHHRGRTHYGLILRRRKNLRFCDKFFWHIIKKKAGRHRMCLPVPLYSVFYFLKKATTTAPGPAWVPMTLPTVV